MRKKDFEETEILRKAIDIFWRKGYNATSLYDLIEGLGIGRSSIYHAFGDKHNLFVKALELYQEEGTARIQQIINTAPSVRQGISDLLHMVVRDVAAGECPKGCFKVNSEVEVAANDELIRKLVYEDDLIIEETLHQAIRKAQNQGEISSSRNPKMLARFFSNAVTGMRVYAKFRNDCEFFDDVIETTISVLDQE